LGLPTRDVVERLDARIATIAREQRDLFRLIVEADNLDAWRDDGAHDLAHWLSIRYGVSYWKAARWIASARALEELPAIAEAFASGDLGIDKVVELTRFATPETERRLLRWALGVSSGCIRRRADLENRRSVEEAREVEGNRSLSWWLEDERTRFVLHGEFPAAEGAVVAKALERRAAELPIMPGEEDDWYRAARMADALVALASESPAGDLGAAGRTTVVLHVPLEALSSPDAGGCELEGGGVVHPRIAERLLCDARLQAVIEDANGRAVGLGRTSRFPSASMARQIRYRDRECVFPGCGARRFTQAHHIVWWDRGGRTDLDNLALVCGFHHKLVHEHG
jgi:hypothetical protein